MHICTLKGEQKQFFNSSSSLSSVPSRGNVMCCEKGYKQLGSRVFFSILFVSSIVVLIKAPFMLSL